MKKLVLIKIFLLFIIIDTVAQPDFRNGYILKNNYDTLYGFIDYKGNKSNAKQCIFKKDMDSENQIFGPEEIIAYRYLESKYYVSKPVLIGNDTIKLFLEYLINGIVDMYYYRDHLGEHYLVGNDKNELDELKSEEKEVFINNASYIKRANDYIGLLRYTFQESPTILRRVDNVVLNHKSLIKIAHDYHNEICPGEECIIYEKKLPKKERKFGLIIGINGMSVSQTNKFADKPYYLINSQFGFNIYPSVGLFYKLSMPFINERIYFQNELSYSHIKLETTNLYIGPGSETSSEIFYSNDITLIQNAFNYLGFIKYESPKGKIRPTFQMGAFAKYFFKQDYNRNVEMTYSGGNTYTSQTDDNPFDNYDFGINLGIGINSLINKDKEIFIDLRYQRGFGLFKGLDTNVYLINFGFQF